MSGDCRPSTVSTSPERSLRPRQAEPEPQPEPQIEEVPVEEVQPITLEELEAIRQEAYNEGFVTGERDGYHAGQLKARQKPRRR